MTEDYDLGTYQLGEYVRITATVTDSDGAAADPASTLIYIKLPTGSITVNGTAMTKAATGSYYYDYSISGETTGIPGVHVGKIKATGSGGRVTIPTFKLTAIKSI